MRVASFFAGIGGFDLGFENAGYEVVFQCEWDPFCQRVLKKHWPEVPLASDINNVLPGDIPDAELWCGGFPCQDVSLANQGKRQGFNGKRSSLFHAFTDLAAERRPEWLVLENVVGLLNANGGEDFRTVLQRLDELGYDVAWRVLDSKYFGTPQRRRRVFVIASLVHGGAARVLFDDGAIDEVVREARRPGAHSPGRLARGGEESNLYAIQHATIGRKPSAGPQAKGWRNDGETYTLDSRGSSDVVCSTHDGFRVREAPGISRELDGRRFRALGNAVNVDVVEWIARRILEVSGKLCTAEQSSGSKHR